MTLEELQTLVVSNARSIQAMGEAIETSRLQAEEERREIWQAIEASRLQAEAERQDLRAAMQRLADAMTGVANLAVSLDRDRPTVLSKLNRIGADVESLKRHLGAE